MKKKNSIVCLHNKMIIGNRRKCFLYEMNRWSLLRVFLCITYSCTSVFAPKPFTFDPFTLQIYNLPDSSDVVSPTPYAVACPAQTEPEKDMNEGESMDHKALFVRYYYDVGEWRAVDLKCKKHFEMAAIFRRKDEAIEFGYEVYFKKKTAPDNVYKSGYTHYGPISEARSVWKQIANDWILRGMWPSLGVGSKNILGFTWIPRITLKYDISEWGLISTNYIIYRNVAKELTIKCKNYDLGQRFYKRKHGPFDKFYSPDEQKKIFKLVKLPEMPEDSLCKTTGECVRKYDFLKPYHFRSSYGSPVSCSNLTTIPVWYEVAEELLNNLEIFLFALGRVTESNLIIYPGVYGTLSFMTNDTRKPKPMEIYLYTKRKRIPVPRILYKIVRYKSHDCNVKEELCWFDIVIVIHNHPGPVKRHMICPRDKCRDYGWEKIKFVNKFNEGEGSEHIYCCKLDEEMQKRLRYKIGNELRGDLNLKDFPVYDQKREENRYVDRQSQIEEQMKRLQLEVLDMTKIKL